MTYNIIRRLLFNRNIEMKEMMEFTNKDMKTAIIKVSYVEEGRKNKHNNERYIRSEKDSNGTSRKHL